MISTLPKDLVESAQQILLKENFNKWFGKSKLKNEDGTPTHFYHGTDKNFNAFSHNTLGVGNDSYGSGFYFTNKPEVASGYAVNKDSPDQPNVMKVHLRLEKPIDPEDEKPLRRDHIKKILMTAPNHMDSLMNFGDVNREGYHKVLNGAVDAFAELPKYHAMNALHNDFYNGHPSEFLKNFTKATGHDGVIIKHGDHTIVNVFHPNQIKSATGNNGEYNNKSDHLTEELKIEHEGELHVENRKNQIPLDHVRDIISNHQSLGWNIDDDEGNALHRPLMMNRGGMGCQRSVKMKHEDGRSMVIHLKFRHGNTTKQREYKVNREFRTSTH